MEHEFEKTIREKINTVEQNPLKWEKDLVWSKIDHPSSRTPVVFYYAAASIVLAGALIFFTIGLNNRKSVDLQLRAIELSIEKNKIYQAELLLANKIATEPIDCVAPTSTREEQKFVASRPVKKNTRIKSPLTPLPEKESTKELNEEIAIAKIDEPLAVINETKPIDTVRQRKGVRAIIGTGYQETALVKERKLSFKLLPYVETESIDLNTSESLTLQSKRNPH
ncbi:hypothetical protein BH10BAC4_BH10BAC4_26750 [soil metagenome]